jgi:hypothetical protein
MNRKPFHPMTPAERNQVLEKAKEIADILDECGDGGAHEDMFTEIFEAAGAVINEAEKKGYL